MTLKKTTKNKDPQVIAYNDFFDVFIKNAIETKDIAKIRLETSNKKKYSTTTKGNKIKPNVLSKSIEKNTASFERSFTFKILPKIFIIPILNK